MKALILIGIVFIGMFSGFLYAQNSVTKGEYLEVTCMVVDSTGAEKSAFAINEPATYILSIRNVSDFPITYRYSSKSSALYSVMVLPYYKVDNTSSSISPFVLDSEGVIESGEVLSDTQTTSSDSAGKYEFVINPNFNFPKQYWPSTGPLYRVFDVNSPTNDK
ncbi:MAG TPA: hypothetical protein PLE74_06860 [Candidatus Cloacimonadota bacterium]|nr:hypothetical protein [Candidatus Cloacimonadota bacterium]HPT71985.1 hypothetical protein [Candidatus Cloacimonadota bacterium]